MTIRLRQRLGKYRIERRLAEGGFGTVYQALDTLEGIRVALKVLRGRQLSKEALADFRHEVRIIAQLDHPHILPLKNAAFIDGRLVLAFPLGVESLESRMRRRMSSAQILNFGEQMLEALNYAHSCQIIHCDVKPDNLILFPNGTLRLTDFGIAKLALRTLSASGSGTVGYMAPEQALGKPTFSSDLFAVGLVLFEMLTGELPEWPFTWPMSGIDRLRRRVSPEIISVLRKSLEVDLRKRYRTAKSMLRSLRLARQTSPRTHSTRRRTAADTASRHMLRRCA